MYNEHVTLNYAQRSLTAGLCIDLCKSLLLALALNQVIVTSASWLSSMALNLVVLGLACYYYAVALVLKSGGRHESS